MRDCLFGVGKEKKERNHINEIRYYTKAMLDKMTPKIKAVQKMQDYIAAHQTEEINLSDLAVIFAVMSCS